MDEQRKQFGSYVRELADLMGLRDWTVHVSPDLPDNPKHGAEADCTFGRKIVSVAFSDAFFRTSRDSQRATVCHELVHAHIAQLHHLLHRILPDPQWEPYYVAMEYAVDAMAESWSVHLPLPPTSSTKGTPMGRQKAVKYEMAEPKPKAKGKGKGKPAPKKGKGSA
jgi:hypothetical protein